MYPLQLIFDDLNKRFYNTSTSFFGELVDRDRYDLVEKPEWKKKRIEAEIAASQRRVESFRETMDAYIKAQKEEEEIQKKLQEELAQLK